MRVALAAAALVHLRLELHLVARELADRVLLAAAVKTAQQMLTFKLVVAVVVAGLLVLREQEVVAVTVARVH